MTRQNRLGLLNDEAQPSRGWTDLFNRIFGEGGLRVAPTAGAEQAATVGPIRETVAVDVVPAADTQATRLGVFTSFPSGPVAPLAAGGLAIMASPQPDGFGRGGPGAFGSGALGYQILYSDDLGPGLIVDVANREIVADGTRNIDLGGGRADLLVLSGPLVAPASLPTALAGLETVVVTAGASYVLIATDDHVARGATLEVNAMRLGADEAIAFDGSAERDGRFLFLGGEGGDVFVGGAGQDILFGHGGGDVLAGGGGADRFGYADASESSGLDFDVLFDFDPGEDRIDLPVTVTGFDAAIETGALSEASFDEDLGAALGGLGAGRAVFFRPDSGDLAGVIFLIVDANGEEGYQAGEDFVFALPSNDLPDLSAHTGFFV